jgi:hypothetical protein
MEEQEDRVRIEEFGDVLNPVFLEDFQACRKRKLTV